MDNSYKTDQTVVKFCYFLIMEEKLTDIEDMITRINKYGVDWEGLEG